MMKNYLLNLLQQCSEEKFGQDAIEWALASGLVHLTYERDRDIRECMSRYDEIIEKYRASVPKTAHGTPNQRAPMERAMPEGRVKSAGASASIKKKKHAA